MKKIGIIVAMDKEYEQLSMVFEDRTDIVLQKCGIGKVNAAVGATEMLRDHQPDLIVSSGCAGGASTSLEVMDVVAASSCASTTSIAETMRPMARCSGCPPALRPRRR